MRMCSKVILSVVLFLGCGLAASGRTSSSLEQFRITRHHIADWSEEPKTYKAFTSKTLFDIINGAAPEYIDNGMRKGFFQRLKNGDSATIELFAEDFGTSENAQKMLLAKQSDGNTDSSGFVINNIIGGFWVCGAVAQYYFELTLMGIHDENTARKVIGRFFEIFQKKGQP